MFKKHTYAFSLIFVLLISICPVYMGSKTISLYFLKGSISFDEYPKYIIPYTPIALSILLVTFFMPIIIRKTEEFALLVATLSGGLIFFLTENFFERITVYVEPAINLTKKIPDFVQVQDWQLSICAQFRNPPFTLPPNIIIFPTSTASPTPDNLIFAANNPFFKIHFYLISIIIIFAFINVLYRILKMVLDNSFARIKPVLAQAISWTVFVGMCIWACFTAFYRTGELLVSPLSAVLMAIFFIVMGVTCGTYLGSIFYRKGKILSLWVPSVFAVLMTFLMYVGELVLKAGILFKLGTGVFFDSFAGTPFALSDFAIIIASGIATFFIMTKIRMFREN